MSILCDWHFLFVINNKTFYYLFCFIIKSFITFVQQTIKQQTMKNFLRVPNNDDFKSSTPYDDGVIYISMTYINYDYETSHLIFFVSGKNGDEFGQFPNFAEALEKVNEVKSR